MTSGNTVDKTYSELSGATTEAKCL